MGDWGENMELYSHFPCGSVDWNYIVGAFAKPLLPVTSLAEVWIEIAKSGEEADGGWVTSLAEVWIEISIRAGQLMQQWVTSLAEVWIEIRKGINRLLCWVTSLAEVWIEIQKEVDEAVKKRRHFPCGSVDWNCCLRRLKIEPLMSLPLRKCGLKYCYCTKNKTEDSRHFPCGSVDWNCPTDAIIYMTLVTSLAEVWIEIPNLSHIFPFSLSLPLRKCGLKLLLTHLSSPRFMSLPLRKCGLKSVKILCYYSHASVTSLAEVWIEILN